MSRFRKTLYIIIGIVLLVLVVQFHPIRLLTNLYWSTETETTTETTETETSIDNTVEVTEDYNVNEETVVSTDDTITDNNTTETTTSNLEVATVVRVVDGDTLVVNVNGADQYVRLIGIDAAESVHPDASKNTEAGQEASNYLKSMLSAGDIVYLQKDVSETDKYNRLLRYVWLEEPTDVWNEDEVISKMLNAILIIDGYADPVRYEPDTSYAELFESL